MVGSSAPSYITHMAWWGLRCVGEGRCVRGKLYRIPTTDYVLEGLQMRGSHACFVDS